MFFLRGGVATRAKAKYCGSTCRQRAKRAKSGKPTKVQPLHFSSAGKGYSGVRQVLLRGSWESVLSWHTWSPGCGVHPLGGVLRRGPPWPGLALAPGGEPVGAGASMRWGVNCVRSRWGSVGRFASLPLLLGLPNALGCRRWGAGCRRRLSTLRLSSLRRPGEPRRPCGLILPELYSCNNIFALS